MAMNVLYAGTPAFAAAVLESLLEQPDMKVVGVLSQPARPQGRGLKETASPVAALAEKAGTPLATPARWSEETTAWVREKNADCLVTVAYGLLVPEPALAATRLGALNVHASLLPRWRGAAPIQRAIESGDAETGISIFVLEKTLDTGPLLAVETLAIGPAETAATLHDRLASLAARLLPETLRSYADGKVAPSPQDESRATHAPKLRKEEGRLAWHLPAIEIERKCRAFQPWPGVTVAGIRLHTVALAPGDGEPGRVLDVDPLVVATGSGALRLDRVQRAGGRPMTGAELARGLRLRRGDTLNALA